MATKQPKNPIIHDDAEMTIKVIDSGVEDTPATGDSVKIGVSHVECIKGILHCEEQIKMQRETIVELRKKLVEELKLDAGFISELISVVKQETHAEKGGGVIEKKTKILDAAEQAVVLYPNVELRPAFLAAVNGAIEIGDGDSSVKPVA